MNKYLKMGVFGFLLWLIPFVVSVLIFPLRAMQRPIFDSIMPVVLTAWTVYFCILYLSGLKSDFLREGLILGLVWLFISIALDLLFFAAGPIKMALLDYMIYISVIYWIIPTITIGFGYMMDHLGKR